MDLYGAAVAHAYLYLFPQFERQRNAYDPQFRRACDIYNASLEEVLRIMKKQGRLQPGQTTQFKPTINGWTCRSPSAASGVRRTSSDSSSSRTTRSRDSSIGT